MRSSHRSALFLSLALLAVAPAHPATADARRKVAILLFNRVEIIDYTGPYELFGAADYDIYTVAASAGPVTTSMGMTVVPKYDFASAPQPDLLVVPGGGVGGAMSDSATLAFVRATAGRAQKVMSVCNGAFILAKAGVLDGLEATTTYRNVLPLQNGFPRVRVVGDRRYVDNGRIVTTAGLSAGMDGALHLIAVMDGEQKARGVALQEEYDWHPQGGYVRPSLADRMVPRFDFSQIASSAGKWDLVSSKGGADQWETAFRGSSPLTANDLLGKVESRCETDLHWVRNGSARRATAATASDWDFAGIGGQRWRGHIEVTPDRSAAGQFMVKLAVAKGS